MPTLAQRRGTAANTHRSYLSARTILQIRFDPMTQDRPSRSVRDERVPIVPPQRFGPYGALVPSPSMARAGVPADGRAAAAAMNANLADAIAKIPPKPDDGLTRYIDAQPLAYTRRVNSFRMADELDARFAWKDIPLDSRLIRSMLVLHFEGTVSADAFAARRAGESPWVVAATRSNLRFIGLLEESDDMHSPSGDYFHLKVRDLTAILLDRKVPQDYIRRLAPDTTVAKAIVDLLNQLPEATLIRGPYFRPDSLWKGVPTVDPASYARVAQSAKGRQLAERLRGSARKADVERRGVHEQGDSYWDVITDLCVAHGLIPMIELDALVLQPARTFFKAANEIPGQANTYSFPSAYRRRFGQLSNVRELVWGVNVESFKPHRKFGRIKAPAVQVIALDPDAPDPSKRRLVVTYKPPGTPATSVSPSGAQTTTEYLTHIVYGVKDPKLLQRTAENIYHSIGRNEFGVTISTSDPTSLGPRTPDGVIAAGFDPNEDPDLLALQSGDPIRLLVAPTERRLGAMYSVTELSSLIAKTRGLARAQGATPEYTSAVAFLQSVGWKAEDAQQLVRLLASANLPSEYRVSTVTFSADFESEQPEFSIEIDARNYVVVRDDPDSASLSGGLDRQAPDASAPGTFPRPSGDVA